MATADPAYDPTLSSSAPAAPVTIDGSALSSAIPLTIKNDKANSGVELWYTGTVATGYDLMNASGTRLGAFAVAGAANDWITGSAADDILIVCGSSKKIRLGADAGARDTITITPGTSTVFQGNGGALTITHTTGDATILQGSGQLTVGTSSSTQPLLLRSGGTDMVTINNLSTQTSGTRKLFAFAPASIAPTSGTAVFSGVDLAYTINQTGGANGNVTGVKIAATETAVGGTHALLDVQVGGTSKFKVGGTTTGAGVQGIGFFNTGPAAQQTSGANLTNSVTSGGTDDTIANFTDLTTYATDAATIRNDIYQLARKLKQINDGLRAFGLFT
jgi:hypothetical protein